MRRPSYRVAVPEGELAATFAAIRAELEVPEEFPPEVLAAAEEAARSWERPALELLDVPFLTLDPKGSTDLDQAMALDRAAGGGYVVRYAIADVPAFVLPSGPVDAEARVRGQTMYAPDGRVPLHPPVLSEGAASLLAGEVRPAFVWTFELGADGEAALTSLERALVRSSEQLDYESEQAAIDAGRARPEIELLLEIGRLRAEVEAARGGVSLGTPDQEIEREDGGYRLVLRPPREIEDANAQLSLMTGMAAAELMLAGGVGVLRTMPVPPDHVVQRLRRQARGLGLGWADDVRASVFLRGLDAQSGPEVALLHEAGVLFRGAKYTAFDGDPPPVGEREQAAIAAPYAHVTAPLRRLVDRFGLVCCEAIAAGRPVPEWVREALPSLPEVMAASDRRANALDRACVDAVEAALLAPHVGETFDAVVVDLAEKGGGGLIQLSDPPVLAKCAGEKPLVLGAAVRARLVEADVGRRVVRFAAI
ncbi:MAG: RNB domain-containing ribonuclease [Baekduia sp.]